MDCTKFSAESLADPRKVIASYPQYKTGAPSSSLLPSPPAMQLFSYGYPGRKTDPQINEACWIAKLLCTGDAMRADRGFLIAQLPTDVKAQLLVAHTRFSKASRHTPNQTSCDISKRLSNVRIHVERAIAALKSFGYFQRKIPTFQKYRQPVLFCCLCSRQLSPLASFRRPSLNNEDNIGSCRRAREGTPNLAR